MATRRELPADVAAALDRVPEAGSHFAALPADRQTAWIDWIDRARGRRARAGRIDEMVRRLLPSAATAAAGCCRRQLLRKKSQSPPVRRRSATGGSGCSCCCYSWPAVCSRGTSSAEETTRLSFPT
ncbi:MAG: YdeI/OmpD-associated family protein [Gaiellaceae bacterium]